jgi:hypothetical protein
VNLGKLQWAKEKCRSVPCRRDSPFRHQERMALSRHRDEYSVPMARGGIRPQAAPLLYIASVSTSFCLYVRAQFNRSLVLI